MEENFASLENLEKLRVYIIARKLAKIVWDIVSKWHYSNRKIMGDQWICATDSISANIAEGYGRFFFNDSTKFYYYAKGSDFESHDWLQKARERNLINDKEYKEISEFIKQIPKELNILIKRIRENAKKYKQQ